MKYFSFFVVLFFFLSFTAYGNLIKNDFRVNDDSTNGRFSFAQTKIFSNGNFIVLWSGQRNGTQNIYAQMYDPTGNTIGQNYKVSTSEASTSEFLHSIAIYHDTLVDLIRGRNLQLLDYNGNRIDTTFYLQNFFPAGYKIAILNGSIFATWAKITSGTGYDIFLQRYNFQGDSTSSTIKINNDVSNANQTNPDIAISESGNIVIVWEDGRNGNYDIYGQLLDSLLNPIANNFIICDSLNAMQLAPVCSMDSIGNFTVFWQDNRNGNGDIYGQRYLPDGSKVGSNFQVNDNSNATYQSIPKCAMDKHGNIFVSWSDIRNGTTDIYCQKYDSLGNSIGSNFKINESGITGNLQNKAIAYTGNNMVSVWEDSGDSTYIYFRLFDNSANAITNTTMINDIKGTSNQSFPRIAMNHSDRTIVIWQDDRIYNGIYYQMFDSLGNTIDTNKILDTGFFPDVTCNENFIIPVYISNTRKKICYRKLNTNGDTLTALKTASNDSLNNKYYPSVAINSTNAFVITWDDLRNGNDDIYFSYFDSLETFLTIDSKVNDDAGNNYQSFPSVSISESGKALIVWTDSRNGNYDIFGQLYDQNANKIGSNFIINDDNTSVGQYSAEANALSDGNFLVVWQDYRYLSTIFAQLIDSSGTLIDSNIQVSQFYSWMPAVSSTPDGKFIITWFGYTSNFFTDYDILAREYNNDLTPIDTIVKINNPPEGINKNQKNATVATNGSIVFFTWEDTKWQKGYDIAANVYTWDMTGLPLIEKKYELKMNVKKIISDGIISIEYILPIDGSVNLSLYDIQGKRIRIINNSYENKGLHKILWNIKDNKNTKVHKGIYFCRLKTGGKSITKKFVLY